MNSKLWRVFAIGSHRGTCVTVNRSNDLDKLLWDTVSHAVRRITTHSIYQVVGLPVVNKGHVQGRRNSRDLFITVRRRSGLHSHVPDGTHTGFC